MISEANNLMEKQKICENILPYRGLLSFREEDAALYFGREVMAKRLLSKIKHQQIVCVVGSSGSGKSSLIYAGLIPELRKFNDWQIIHFRPGAKPFSSLAISLMPHINPNAKDIELLTKTKELIDFLISNGIYLVVEQLVLNYSNEKKLLIFIDQFEELYTLCKETEIRKLFLDSLLETLKSHQFSNDQIKLVLTLRGDFYGKIVGYRPLSEALQDNVVNLPPMNREELRRAIQNPASKFDVFFENSLVERILNDVGDESGNLPLLQFSLSLMWDKKKNKIIDNSAYEHIGGLAGAIANRAEDVFQTLNSKQKEAAKYLFTKLIHISHHNEEGEDTRQRAPFKEIIEFADISKIAYELTSARLLVMGKDDFSGEEYIELAHEAIIKSWFRLKDWLVEDREFLLWKQRMTLIFIEWKSSNYDESLLLRGNLLNEAERWITIKSNSNISQNLYDFIQNSVELNKKEKRVYALSQIENLLSCKPEEISNIIKMIDDHRLWIDPKLKEMLNEKSLGIDEWRVRLALLPVDKSQVKHLAEQIMQTNPQELLIIREFLLPYKDELKKYYWSILDDIETDIDKRFLAACILAIFDPSNNNWSIVSNTIVERLLIENPLYLREWIQALLPIGNVLLSSLREQFIKGEVETIREAAAVVLSKFAVNDPETLASLVSESTFQSYKMLFNVLTSDEKNVESGRRKLKKIILKTPTGDLYESERVFLGKKRAVAAITLLHMEERESIYDVFKVDDDPEALTQFIHQAKKRNIRSELLFECLETTTASQVRYALLLALGEYEYYKLSVGDRNKIKNILTDWYLTENSSGVHGACEWLLRHYGFQEVVDELNIISKPFDPNSTRKWFNIQIDEKKFITFVTYPPGRFIMGSPEWEKERSHSESPQHEVIITRPFAICNCLVTRGNFEQFIKENEIKDFPNINGFSSYKKTPIVSVNWYESVEYCRWLTKKIGFQEADQCYIDPESLEKNIDGYPVNWPFIHDNIGFRLPTEAEWEYACRCGTVSSFSFGCDSSLIPYYGWMQSNAELKTHEVGYLRPNIRGLFDTHGNCWEWCHDWYGAYPVDPVTDPIGQSQGIRHALKGGCMNLNARWSRSACRNAHLPINRNTYIGFRLCISIKEVDTQFD